MGSPAARFAVVGNPVAHSRSPQIHALFGAQTGLALTYERLLAPLDAFDATIDTFFAAGGRGLNVTVPFKEQAWARAQAHLSERARAAGAVNTLWLREGVLAGCNTDGVGLLRDLQRLGAPLAQAHVLVVGAGGAARGAVATLRAAGCASVRVANRTLARAQALVADLADGTLDLQACTLADAARAGGWHLVINATASGLQDAAPDLPPALYAPDAWAYDMVYGSRPTPFMVQADAAGARTADGLGMLVEQAAESFFLWHGVRPQTGPVVAALRASLATEA